MKTSAWTEQDNLRIDPLQPLRDQVRQLEAAVQAELDKARLELLRQQEMLAKLQRHKEAGHG